MNTSKRSGTRSLLGLIARTILLWFVIAAGNLTAFYVAAGVALNGNWERVNNAVEDAWDGLFDDN